MAQVQPPRLPEEFVNYLAEQDHTWVALPQLRGSSNVHHARALEDHYRERIDRLPYSIPQEGDRARQEKKRLSAWLIDQLFTASEREEHGEDTLLLEEIIVGEEWTVHSDPTRRHRCHPDWAVDFRTRYLVYRNIFTAMFPLITPRQSHTSVLHEQAAYYFHVKCEPEDRPSAALWNVATFDLI